VSNDKPGRRPDKSVENPGGIRKCGIRDKISWAGQLVLVLNN